jgi:hypothetical protein
MGAAACGGVVRCGAPVSCARVMWASGVKQLCARTPRDRAFSQSGGGV